MKVVKVDFSEIEKAIQSGNRVTVKTLANVHGVSPLVIRRTLNDHYGNRIEFKRGRNGGVTITDG